MSALENSVPRVGSAKTHATTRRKLRQRLEAAGLPSDEVKRRVEELRERQGREIVAFDAPLPPKAERPRQERTKNYPRKRSLALRDGEFCHWCKAPLDIRLVGVRHTSPPRATLDHVIPKSQGGPNNLGNLVLSCEPCNAARGGVHNEGAFPQLVGLPSAKGRASHPSERMGT